MKYGRFLKIGAPILGVSALVSTSAVIATSCSSGDEIAPEVLASKTISEQIFEMYNGFNTNKQALGINTNWQQIKNKMDDFVDKFNKNNAKLLKEAQPSVKGGLKLFVEYTPQISTAPGTTLNINVFLGSTNNFNTKSVLTIYKTNVVSSFTVAITNASADGRSAQVNVQTDGNSQAFQAMKNI